MLSNRTVGYANREMRNQLLDARRVEPCIERSCSALSFFPFARAAAITAGQSSEGMRFRCFHFLTLQ